MTSSILFNPARYETVYGVSIFDDMHNYLPEVLYDTELFSSSPILMFIQRRIQTLFESDYVQNRTRYRMFQQSQRRQDSGIFTSARNLFTPLPVRSAVHTTVQEQVQTQAYPTTPAATYVDTILRTPPRIQRRMPVRTQTAFLDSTQLGSGLSALLLSAITGSDMTQSTEDLLQQSLSQFMNPVPIAPTAEQLHTATFLTVIEPPAETVCSICQDHSSEDNTSGEWRYIRHCNHAFHRSCIDHWFQEHVQCPVCRFDIRQHPMASNE